MADVIYKIQAPDGTILKIQGPEGASEAQLKQVAQEQYMAKKGQAAKEAPKPAGREAPEGKANVFASPETQYDPLTGVPLGMELPTKIGAATLAAGKGMLDPLAGIAQFFGINAPARKLEQVGQTAKEIGGTPASVAEFTGQLASPVGIKGGALAERAVTGALPKLGGSTVARMGAQGAAQGAMMPVAEGSDYGDMFSEKLKQAASGASLGALAGKATQMAMAPQVSERVQALKDMGMKYFTPGQLAGDLPVVGKGLQKLEQELTSLPLSGSLIQRGLKTSAEDFNRAIGNKILEPIGENLPKDVRPGNEMMGYLADKLDDVYRGLENKITFHNLVDTATNKSTVSSLINRFTAEAADKPIAHQRLILDEFKNAVLDNLQRKGSLSGAEFRQAEKALGSKAKAYMARPETQDVGFALRNLQDVLRNELTAQNPAVGRELRASHEMFKRYLRAERAAAYRGAEEGVFTPSQFRGAVETLAGRKGTATGRGMMVPEAQAATDVLGRTAPDSGTAGRLMTPAAIGRTLGAGAVEGGANVATMGGPLAATALMYNRPMMGAMTKMATERPEMLMRAAPIVAPLAARAAAMPEQPKPSPQMISSQLMGELDQQLKQFSGQ